MTVAIVNSHRPLFYAAACFNWLAGIPLLVATAQFARLLGLELNATASLFIHITAAVIIVFGGVYALIARDPVRYRVYIPLGIVLKICLVAIVYGWWYSGGIPWPLPALAAGDILFAALFWRYLRATGASRSSTTQWARS